MFRLSKFGSFRLTELFDGHFGEREKSRDLRLCS